MAGSGLLSDIELYIMHIIILSDLVDRIGFEAPHVA